MQTETPSRLRRIVLLLAGVVVLAVAGWWIVRREPPNRPAPRAADGVDLPQQEDVYPAADEELDASPSRLRWAWQPGAVAYRVQVTSLETGLLWESGATGATEIVLPEEVRGRIASGGEFLWRVEVRGPAPVSQLGPYRFVVH